MRRTLSSCSRMLTSTKPALRWSNAAPSRPSSSAAGGAVARHGTQLLTNSHRVPNRLAIVTCSMPQHDLDSMLISRRALSSLQKQEGSARSSSDSIEEDASSVISSSAESAGSASDAESAAQWDEVQAHKRAAVQQAFINNSLGFGFSAGGLVFPYYVGLVSSLVQHGVMTRPAQLAGSSAGSLIAASYNAGLDMATVEKSMIEFGEDCLKNGTRYRLGPLLREFLDAYLPQDAHELCSGNTHVAVTRLLPYWRTQTVSHFESREDLMQALLTSCHIPWYFDGRWMTKFRGHYCVDGGVMAFIPSVPDVDFTVKVMCFPSSHLSKLKGATANSRRLKRIHRLLDIDITMDTFEDWPYDLQQVLKWALLASAQETSSLLIEKGKRDATAWFEAMELAPLVAAKQSDQQLLTQQGAGKQQQQQQQHIQEVVVLPSAQAGAGAPPSSSASSSDGLAASDWTDEKQHQRNEEAEGVHEKTAEAGDADDSVVDIAAGDSAGQGRKDKDAHRAAKHAAELVEAGLTEPPTKRRKVAGAAAATVAAAVGKVAEEVGSVVGRDKEEAQGSKSDS